MSSIINKVKDALHHDSSTTTSGTNTGTTGHTTGHNTVGSTTGNTSGVPEGAAGPHSSRTANAADPRIDSDMDHRGNRVTGHGTHHDAAMNQRVGGSSGLTGSTGHSTGNSGFTDATGSSTGNTTGGGYGSTNAGPHSSNMANRLDPTVHSQGAGTSGLSTGTTGHSTGNLGLTGSGGYGSTNTGIGGGGDRGGLSNSTNAGPHNSNIANKMDPRVDDQLNHSGNRHGNSHSGILGASGSHATAGSGTAQNTNGPHNSDTLNKLDPRVDADGDGSKTYMGNKTHA